MRLASVVSSLYKQRRHRLMGLLSPGGEDCLAVIPSTTTAYSSPDVPYPFRQNMNLFYLTGHNKPDTILVLSQFGGVFSDFIFLPPYSPEKARWEGNSVTPSQAARDLHMTGGFDLSQILEFLNSHPAVPIYMETLNSQLNWPKILAHVPRSAPLEPFLESMRLQKDAVEVDHLKKSCGIMCDSLKHVMRLTQSRRMTEYEIVSSLRYQVDQRGADGFCFPPVVACGNNSTIIHYMDYKDRPEGDDLILVDCGCQVNYYCSDLTRVWPVSGRFTEPQRRVYECVLAANIECIESFKRHNSLNFVNNLMREVLAEGLVRHGIVRGEVRGLRELCPHHVSHYLGLDVHDGEGVSLGMRLRGGFAVTVEPGLYFGRDCRAVGEEFRGIGVRIEDDLLITEDSAVVLTEGCPKEVDHVEGLLAAQ